MKGTCFGNPGLFKWCHFFDGESWWLIEDCDRSLFDNILIIILAEGYNEDEGKEILKHVLNTLAKTKASK